MYNNSIPVTVPSGGATVSSVPSILSAPNLSTPSLYPAGSTIFITAMSRWLNVSELEALLRMESTPLTISTQPPPYPPPSGTLILYDRSQTRNYKDDGYEWIKKKNSPKIREDHVKLRVGGRYRVAGSYVHSANNASFHRRAYHLLDPNTGTALYPPNSAGSAAATAATAAALLNSTGTATPSGGAAGRSSSSVVSQDGNTTVGSAASGRSLARSLVLVHYLDTEMAAIHTANLGDSDSGSRSSRGSSRRGRRRRTEEPAALLGVASPEQQAALQAQVSEVAQFQQQQAVSQLLLGSRITPQQIQQLAAATSATQQQQQQLYQQQLQQAALLQVQQQQQPLGTVSLGGTTATAATASSAPLFGTASAGIVQPNVVTSSSGRSVGSLGTMPPPPAPTVAGMLAQLPLGLASPSGGGSVTAVGGIAGNTGTTNIPGQGLAGTSASSVVSGTPTPPLEQNDATSFPLRNEQQLHRLQARLHHEDQGSARASPSPADAASPSLAPASREKSGRSNSGAMDDDTLDILWGMVVEEGRGADGGGSALSSTEAKAAGRNTASALANILDSDDKIGDMLEDTEGLLMGAGDFGSLGGESDFDSDLANEAVADALSQADDRKRSADTDLEDIDSGDNRTAVINDDEEKEMAAIAASAVAAFEKELLDARRASAAAAGSHGNLDASSPGVASGPAAAAAPAPLPNDQAYPSLQSQIAILQERQRGLQAQQMEADRQIQLARHQQLQTQLQERGTLNPSQLALATDSLAQQMSSQAMGTNFLSNSLAASAALGSSALPTPQRSQGGSSMSEENGIEPLPDLLDFTPESANVPVGQNPPKVMLSCSDPLPAVPDLDQNIFQWHCLAAFVSASVNAANGSILDIHKLDLSPVRQINPYTLRSSVPVTAMTAGERWIIVVAIQLYAGTNPICEGVAAGVAASLQQAWALAVQADNPGSVAATLAKKPVFMNSVDLGAGQIKLLTQFSDDLFIFRAAVGS